MRPMQSFAIECRIMGVSGTVQNRKKRTINSEIGKGIGPSAGVVVNEPDENLSGEIEVEVAQRNMKVSTEAWRAFQVYQKYEDWSSETEKTDYTYSRLSKYHTREVIPGIPVRPNLCRSPIKPSSPTSLFDYTSEMENSCNAQIAVRRRKIVNEDHTDNVVLEAEEQSLYRRFAQSLAVTWYLIQSFLTSSVERLRSTITKSSSVFVSSFVYIWYLITTASSAVGSSAVRLWNILLRRNNQGADVSSQSISSSIWRENIVTIWIKRQIHRVYTVVNMTYYNNIRKQNTSTKRNYWWLILIPLLLFAGWCVYDKDESFPYISADSTLLGNLSLDTFSSGIRGLHGTVYSTTSSLCYLFIDGVISIKDLFIDTSASLRDSIIAISYNFWTYSVHSVKFLYANSFGSFWESWGTWFSTGTEALANGFAKLLDLGRIKYWISSGIETIGNWIIAFFDFLVESIKGFGGLFIIFYKQFQDLIPERSGSDTIWEEKQSLEEGLDLEKKEKGIETSGSSYISEITKKIDELEERLYAEKFLRRSEELNVDSRLQEYHRLLQHHRLTSAASLRRCCRWPCPAPQMLSPTSQSPAIDTSVILTDVNHLVNEMQQKTADDIALLRAEIANAIAAKDKSMAMDSSSYDAGEIRKIITEAIKIYDADKTGRADYALESAGGRVVSIRCTKAYSNKAYPLGLPLFWVASSSPEDAIRPGTLPGECWAFQGSIGYLVLELSYPVKVTGFTMEHISKTLSPSGTIDSAPQHFSIWGLKHADDLYEQYMFGDYKFEDSGETLQYFPVKNPTGTVFKFVELKIISNHGHPDYTCLYRIRIHGEFNSLDPSH